MAENKFGTVKCSQSHSSDAYSGRFEKIKKEKPWQDIKRGNAFKEYSIMEKDMLDLTVSAE